MSTDQKNAGGRPRQYKTVEEMQEVIDCYFDDCKENESPVTVSGLALALDLSRQGLLNYEGRDEFVDTIKRAKQRVEIALETHLLIGRNVTGAIFNLKNNFGWKDKHEVEQTGNVTVEIVRFGDNPTDEERTAWGLTQ